MDVKYETKKRLDISKKISSSLEGIVEGVMLGGSMGYGQNYSVHKNSDIDFVVVTNLESLNDLSSIWYFENNIPNEIKTLFLDPMKKGEAS